MGIFHKFNLYALITLLAVCPNLAQGDSEGLQGLHRAFEGISQAEPIATEAGASPFSSLRALRDRAAAQHVFDRPAEARAIRGNLISEETVRAARQYQQAKEVFPILRAREGIIQQQAMLRAQNPSMALPVTEYQNQIQALNNQIAAAASQANSNAVAVDLMRRLQQRPLGSQDLFMQELLEQSAYSRKILDRAEVLPLIRERAELIRAQHPDTGTIRRISARDFDRQVRDINEQIRLLAFETNNRYASEALAEIGRFGVSGHIPEPAAPVLAHRIRAIEPPVARPRQPRTGPVLQRAGIFASALLLVEGFSRGAAAMTGRNASDAPGINMNSRMAKAGANETAPEANPPAQLLRNGE